jgi:hypothetical protein
LAHRRSLLLLNQSHATHLVASTCSTVSHATPFVAQGCSNRAMQHAWLHKMLKPSHAFCQAMPSVRPCLLSGHAESPSAQNLLSVEPCNTPGCIKQHPHMSSGLSKMCQPHLKQRPQNHAHVTLMSQQLPRLPNTRTPDCSVFTVLLLSASRHGACCSASHLPLS